MSEEGYRKYFDPRDFNQSTLPKNLRMHPSVDEKCLDIDIAPGFGALCRSYVVKESHIRGLVAFGAKDTTAETEQLAIITDQILQICSNFDLKLLLETREQLFQEILKA